MPIGGQLQLKGGLQVKSTGIEKKKKKKKKKAEDGEEGQKNADGVGISVMSNKTYEEEFALELDNKKKYKGDTEILKSKKVKSAAARLDIRSKMKSDKFCK